MANYSPRKTLRDLQQHVLDAGDAQGGAVDQRRALRAAIAGASEVSSRHNWKDYRQVIVQTFSADVSLTVDIASGVATVTAGSIPSWATSGSLKISTNYYRVISVSGSDLTIDITGGDDTDVSATIVHNRILIADKIRNIASARLDWYGSRDIGIIDGVDLIALQQSTTPPSTYLVAAVLRYQGSKVGDSAVMDTRTELAIHPPPGASRRVILDYRRYPREATVVHDCGDITIDGGDLDAVTLTNALPARVVMRDSALIVSESATSPEGGLGSGVENSFTAVAAILPVSSASGTTVALSENYQATSGVNGILSDFVDIPSFAWVAATMYAEAHYARLGQGDTKMYAMLVQAAYQQLMIAQGQEAEMSEPGAGGAFDPANCEVRCWVD